MKLLTYLQKTKQVTRRDFEEMIKIRSISVNGADVESFSHEIAPGDELVIRLPRGQAYTETIAALPKYRPRLVLFHKPAGYVVSKDDPHNKTIFELLPAHRRDQYYPIGRLDKDSTGLLLLTNDPGMVDYYENPKNAVHKVYDVTITPKRQTKHTIKACKGLWVTEQWSIATEKEQAEFLSFLNIRPQLGHPSDKIQRVLITLTEWKKRHIRRLLKALGYTVRSLVRIKIGKRTLGTLKPGKRRIEHKTN